MKKKTRTVLLCAGLIVCMSVFLRTHVMADNAFVVEEEAIIGGGSLQEGQGQTEAPAQVPPPAVQEPVAGQKHAGGATKSRALKEKKVEEPEEEKKEEATQEQEENMAEKEVSVSQNSGVPAFQVPVRKRETQAPKGKAEEKGLQQPETQEEMQQTPEPHMESAAEQENLLARRKQNPWWMLALGGIFFLGGCVRFLWRIRDGKR